MIMCTKGSETIHIYNDEKIDLKSEIEKLNLKEKDEATNFCDLTEVINKFNTWIKRMPRVKPYYAIKCNDERPLIKILGSLGTGFDCASKNEIDAVLELGINPNRIVYANPVKSKSSIKHAQLKNVTDSTVDNEFEIYKIFKHYPESNVILRIRANAKKALSPFGNKFGCDADDDGAALMLLAKSLEMNMIGLSFHVGSGCEEFTAYDRAISRCSNLYKFGLLIDHNMKTLDIGGGFPGDDDILFANMADTINNSLDKYFSELEVKVIAEPGRFFVHTAYTSICKVYSRSEVRSSDGQLEKTVYYINDGVYGTFCLLLYEPLPIQPIHFKGENCELFDSLIWGPTLCQLDKIVESVELPILDEGDILAIPKLGAYSVPLMCNFNGIESPITRFYLRSDYCSLLKL